MFTLLPLALPAAGLCNDSVLTVSPCTVPSVASWLTLSDVRELPSKVSEAAAVLLLPPPGVDEFEARDRGWDDGVATVTQPPNLLTVTAKLPSEVVTLTPSMTVALAMAVVASAGGMADKPRTRTAAIVVTASAMTRPALVLMLVTAC
jgi:hypothetical protein